MCSYFRHSQIGEVVRERYLLDQLFLTQIHSLMAEFYQGKWSGIAKKPFSLSR